MSGADPGPGGEVWGRQHPFERTHLQRSITVLALGSVFSVTLILFVRTDLLASAGAALVGAGVVVGLAAGSRHRYVREARLGPDVLRSRDGRFVLGSGAGLTVTALLVAALIVVRAGR